MKGDKYMRYSITLNNQKCLEWQLNSTQGILVALLNEASSWAKEEIINGNVYYFVSRNLILKELPMFFEKADTVYRNLKILAEKGIIEYIKYQGKDLIRLTEKGKTWNYLETELENQNSEIFPNIKDNSEKNPSKFGKKSENNSEKNPTDKDTSNKKNTSKNIKEKINKKEKTKNEVQDFITNLDRDYEYKELLLKYVEYRKSIKKTIKTVLPIQKIIKDFPDWFSLNEAINIAITKEWQGLEPEWIARYKQSKVNNFGSKMAETKDTSHLKVDDNYLEQMKERYGF